MPDENVELVREVIETWNADQSNPPYEYLDPEIEWETRWPGLPRYFYGHEGIKEWVDRVLEPMKMSMNVIEARSVDHETVLAKFHVRGEGRGSGVPTEMAIFDLYSIRNGMVYRRRTFYTEAEALQAAGLSE